MGSLFPGALDTLATDKTDATPAPGDHADHHNALADAVNKIEAELGINPSGALATVVARLAGIESDVAADGAAAAAAQATANAALPKAGGTMTGDVVLAGDPTANLHPATRQYVLAQIAALVAGAPGTLDTLNEIAAQLSTDESAVSALTASVAGKLAAANNLSDLANAGTARTNLGLGSAATHAHTDYDAAGSAAAAQAASQPLDADLTAVAALTTTAFGRALLELADAAAGRTALAAAPLASPTFTGDPKAPTPAQGDNDTSIATSAYVQTELGFYVPKSLVDAKGDLLVGTADNTVARKAVGTNGKGLVADSTQSDGLTYRHQFRPPHKVGRYYNAGPQGGTHNQSNAAQFGLFAMPLSVPQDWAFDRIGIEVQTAGASGAAARLCVYADDGNCYPGALLYNCGTVAGDAGTGWKEITGLSMSGHGPLIWVAVELLGPSGRPTLRAFTNVNDDRVAGAADVLNLACSYTLTLGSDSLPDPFTAAAATSNVAFKIGLRAA